MDIDIFLEILEFLYYGIIIFIIIIFFTMIIDITISKLFPNKEHNFIIIELFVTWIFIILLCFYSKKIILMLPSPFEETRIFNNHINTTLLFSLIPIVIGVSLLNMKNKSQKIYEKINKFF
jgi:hypothetical protein